MLYLGQINTRADLPEELIPRSEAAQYFDILTLQPMLQIIENVGFIKYHAIMLGKEVAYFDIGEIQKWGETKGYDFCHSSEISYEWREYLHTLDRIYIDVARLNELGRQMEFDEEEMQTIPPIEHKEWPRKAPHISLRDPRKAKQPTSDTQEVDQKIPSAIYHALEEKYKKLRSKVVGPAKKSEQDKKAPLAITRRGNRFSVRVCRKVLGEQINLYRSFFIESDAINWARDISEELDVLAVLGQVKFGGDAEGNLSLSRLIQNPDEYLKAGNGYLVEMAHRVIATEAPTEDGGYASIEVIHQQSVAFEKTVVCGIYFLIRDGEIKYVGQSIDILKRIREHRQHAYIKFDRFSMIPVRREKLFEVETWYIRHFRPPFNKTRMRPSLTETRVQRKRELIEKRLRDDAEAATRYLQEPHANQPLSVDG